MIKQEQKKGAIQGRYRKKEGRKRVMVSGVKREGKKPKPAP